ncbi:hypothetical protein TrispH2_011265 [Trichoplax sp. H2]|uniref:Uncharacterized protein n=1 Tax=Trichoplax adhaerens TaxID=10228 RepID=B3SDI2_TRIAD|nr:predicted protein [Trichoplax adhaerens]EDV19237.1 predicted protein [Trichoplax adhaerens]RDD36899.1 hypothetical protein TrispH2_011265 [Trichoplax sp. H2]|eukprot:XP_002118303.1 predicted protein [Trichoplax adhaerens]
MPAATIITPDNPISSASIKIVRFYYICVGCILTGIATFITGIIGAAVNYGNFAASAGTGIWTSIFVIAAGGLGILIKSYSRNDVLATRNNIQAISTQQSMLELLQQTNQQATAIPPSYSNEPPPSYASSVTMQNHNSNVFHPNSAFKTTTVGSQNIQLPNIPQTQPPPY